MNRLALVHPGIIPFAIARANGFATRVISSQMASFGDSEIA
jgi:hypothetical protein